MTYNLYTILGLNKNDDPSQNDIKKAFKKLALEHHPDKNKNNPDAEKKFKEMSHAYDILTDENKKKIYDQTGDENFNEQNQGNSGSMGPFGSMHASDIFEQFFRQHHHPFFGNHFNDNSKCENIQKVHTISLDEAFEGINATMKINVSKYCQNCLKQCKNCNGSGTVKQVNNMGFITQIFQGTCGMCNGSGFKSENNKSCFDCKGTGKYNKEFNAFLNLPAGIDDGFKTCFPDMGEQPKKPQEKAGDLILEIKISEHPNFVRKGNDLYYKCKLSFIESIIGKDIVIPYFKENININTNIFGVVHPNKSYLIENKGMPITNTKNYGNMFIEFNIKYPKIKNKDKLEKLEEILNRVFYE